MSVWFILPLAGAVPWGHADKGNHQLGKELTAAGGGRQDTAEACADVWQPEYDHFSPRS